MGMLFKKLSERKSSVVLLFLVAGVLVLSFGFLLSSCGKGPQIKVSDPNKGAFAVDFTDCPNYLLGKDPTDVDICWIGLAEHVPIDGPALTIEAWINLENATDYGAIFTRQAIRLDEPTIFNGVALLLNVDLPDFYPGCFEAGTGKVCFIVGDNKTPLYTVPTDITTGWHHIAAVLVSEDHTLVHNECTALNPGGFSHLKNCPTEGCRDDIPHIDIYVDGEYRDCNTSAQAEAPPAHRGSIGRHPALGLGERFLTNDFDGIIDEVRVWTVARTQAEIQACKDQELGVEGGICGINPDILKGYWRLNEGEGFGIRDASGAGNGGSKRYCYAMCSGDAELSFWPSREEDEVEVLEDGWVEGKVPTIVR